MFTVETEKEHKFVAALGDATGRIIRLEDKGWLEYRYAPGNTCEIVNLEVFNGHRRKGIGRSLLEELVQTVGTNTIYAFTHNTNRIAKDWYQAMGFRIIRVKNYYGNNEDSCLCWRGVHGNNL